MSAIGNEKVALVTGGARGIGRAIALALADRGWSVAVCYRTSRQDAEAGTVTVRKFSSAGGLQHVVDVVPAHRNRLAEQAVQRLPGDSQPWPRWAGQAVISG